MIMHALETTHCTYVQYQIFDITVDCLLFLCGQSSQLGTGNVGGCQILRENAQLSHIACVTFLNFETLWS